MAGAGTIHDGWRSCLKCSPWVAALLLACAVATGCTVTTDVCDSTECGMGQECLDVDGSAVCLTPCATADDCPDDGDPCTTAVCEADARVDEGTFCTTSAVDCGAELCDPETGACVECIDDDCTAPQICVDHACATTCTSDGDCDDGLACNGTETCDPAAICVPGTAPDCDDGLDCTDDACAEPDGCTNTSLCPEEMPVCTSGGCVECVEDVHCDDGLVCNGAETCDPATGCVAGTAPDCADEFGCTTDVCEEPGGCANINNCPEYLPFCALAGCFECVTSADCDDGLACNGEEDCDEGSCDAGYPFCGGTFAPDCVETEDGPMCVDLETGAQFFSIGHDHLTGTEGDDLFEAPLWFNMYSIPRATFQTGDFLDGLGGVDSLNATFNPPLPTTVLATLLNIELLNLTNWGQGSLTLTGSGITDVTSLDSVADIIVNNLSSIANGHLDGLTYDYYGAAKLQLAFQASVTAGNSDEIDLTITNTTNAVFEIVAGAANGFETINITSFGDEANTLSSLVQTTGTTLATMVVDGDQDLQIGSLPSTITTCDASAMTGGLTVTLAGTLNEGTTITGGIGDDNLTGSDQSDVIEGGAGADTLTGGRGADVFVYTVETDSLNTALDTVTDFISGNDKFDVPNPPTNAGDGSAGADLNHVTVTSTGETASTLAQDLAAVADGAAANEWDQPGDTHVVRLRGQSIGGTDAVYLVIEDGTHPTTYDATEDLVLLVSDRRDVTLSLSDFQ